MKSTEALEGIFKSGFLSAICLCMVISLQNNALAQDADLEKGQYDYPELTVVPRASERVRLEASRESQNRWALLPIQVSGLSTLLTGIVGYDSNRSGPYLSAIGVGGGWVALTVLMQVYYMPYRTAYNEVGRMPKDSIRDQLTKERDAEERIRKIASLGEKMRWISILTNLGASIAVMTQGGDNKGLTLANGTTAPSSTPTTGIQASRQGFAAVSIALALAPLFFRPYWKDVYEEQMDYKKRIYAPVANAAILYDAGERQYVPGVQLALSF